MVVAVLRLTHRRFLMPRGLDARVSFSCEQRDPLLSKDVNSIDVAQFDSVTNTNSDHQIDKHTPQKLCDRKGTRQLVRRNISYGDAFQLEGFRSE
jgi:hypothetical protein